MNHFKSVMFLSVFTNAKSTSEIFLSGKISTNAFDGFSICGKQDYCILWASATDFKRQEKKTEINQPTASSIELGFQFQIKTSLNLDT